MPAGERGSGVGHPSPIVVWSDSPPIRIVAASAGLRASGNYRAYAGIPALQGLLGLVRERAGCLRGQVGRWVELRIGRSSARQPEV